MSADGEMRKYFIRISLIHACFTCILTKSFKVITKMCNKTAKVYGKKIRNRSLHKEVEHFKITSAIKWIVMLTTHK